MVGRKKWILLCAILLGASGLVGARSWGAPAETPAAASEVAATPPAAAPQPAPATPPPAAEKPSPLAKPFTIVWDNGLSFTVYGKLDMVMYYDSAGIYVSDWYVFVNPRHTYDGDKSSFSASARGSLFGFKFNYPQALAGGDVNARVEVDFVGGFISGAMSTYSPLMRMKHAYVSWDTPHHSLLLGQTTCLFQPLFPDTGTWIALGASGNPWMRLPQVQYRMRYQPIEVAVSVARMMGANQSVPDSTNDIIHEGEQSARPLGIGRLGFSQGQVAMGVSGTYGREQIHRRDTAAGIQVDKRLGVWMVGYDFKWSSRYVDLLGEFFVGSNLNTFFAGVLQGVNTTSADAHGIRTAGGWGQVTLRPWNKLYFNLGAGIDDPKNSDLIANQRAYNLTIFGNANYKLLDNWVLSAEPVYMQTGYLGAEHNSNLRWMMRTAFSF